MTRPFVRYLCHVTPPGHALGDVGYGYFSNMLELGLEVRVIPLGAVQCDGGRWAGHEAAFLRPVPESFVNVVCGTQADLARCHTAGVVNVAIGGDAEGYQGVWCEGDLEDILTRCLDE